MPERDIKAIIKCIECEKVLSNGENVVLCCNMKFLHFECYIKKGFLYRVFHPVKKFSLGQEAFEELASTDSQMTLDIQRRMEIPSKAKEEESVEAKSQGASEVNPKIEEKEDDSAKKSFLKKFFSLSKIKKSSVRKDDCIALEGQNSQKVDEPKDIFGDMDVHELSPKIEANTETAVEDHGKEVYGIEKGAEIQEEGFDTVDGHVKNSILLFEGQEIEYLEAKFNEAKGKAEKPEDIPEIHVGELDEIGDGDCKEKKIFMGESNENLIEIFEEIADIKEQFRVFAEEKDNDEKTIKYTIKSDGTQAKDGDNGTPLVE